MKRGAWCCGVVLGAAVVLCGSLAGAAQPYLIGGGDSLQISVWKNPELSQSVVVRPDGMVTLPLVNDIPASNRTAMELARSIEEKLSAFVNAPNVTVTVAVATNFRVYTHGAVANGMFSLTAPVNALQLLARAGGPTADADPAAAFVLRGSKRIFVDLRPRAATEADAATCCPELLPEDVLVVPFKDVPRRILVAGEVHAPSSLPFKEGMTVLDAFVAAGGGTEFADLDSVKVVRAGADRQPGEIDVDLSRMLSRGDLKKNLVLSPGDIVVVPR